MSDDITALPATGHRARLPALSILCSLVLLAGCSLPGYHMDAKNTGYWYASDEAEATWPAAGPPQDIHYDARMVLISPMLIKHLRDKRESKPLDPAVQSLIGTPELNTYRVGPGDVLQVIVFGHEDLTNPMGSNSSDKTLGQLVSADGTLYFPYVGELKVDGLTLKQIRQQIAHGLSDYIRKPQVDVRVRDFRSKRIIISGDIAKPCTVPLTNIPLTVLRALDKCPTLVSANKEGPFGIQNVNLIRDGQIYHLSLNELYQLDKPIALHGGDRLIVNDTSSRVFMVGEFSEQRALPYTTGGMTLGDAIADTGGLNLGTADASSIYVIRGFMNPDPDGDGREITLRPKVFHLDASSVNALVLANNFQLEPRDVVYAAPASMVNFNRALALLTPTLDQLFRSFLIYDRARD